MSLLLHTQTSCVLMLQGQDGHLKPIPPEDDFATPRRGGTGGRTPPSDPDLALAIRLQQEEMARLRAAPAPGPREQPPPFVQNPVGPTPSSSLPQRARYAAVLSCSMSHHQACHKTCSIWLCGMQPFSPAFSQLVCSLRSLWWVNWKKNTKDLLTHVRGVSIPEP